MNGRRASLLKFIFLLIAASLLLLIFAARGLQDGNRPIPNSPAWWL